MPHVRDLEARHEFERFRPICASIPGDRCLIVALCPFLHVARLSRPVTIQSSTIAPFRVELDPVRRVRDHQTWLALAKQPRDDIRAGSIATNDAMIAEHP